MEEAVDSICCAIAAYSRGTQIKMMAVIRYNDWRGLDLSLKGVSLVRHLFWRSFTLFWASGAV